MPSLAQSSTNSPSGSGPTAATAVSAYMAALKQRAAAAERTRDGGVQRSLLVDVSRPRWAVASHAFRSTSSQQRCRMCGSSVAAAWAVCSAGCTHDSDLLSNPHSGGEKAAVSGTGESMHAASAPDAKSAVDQYVEGLKSRSAQV